MKRITQFKVKHFVRFQVQVSVVSPPVLSPIVFPPGLRSGDRAQITCTVTSGDMPVYFSWLKDQMPISSALQVSFFTILDYLIGDIGFG